MNCSENKTSELHSVVFKTNPPNKWTTKLARKWLMSHSIKPIKMVDRTINSLRYRIVSPECFLSFSTKVIKTDQGVINLVIGWYILNPKGGRLKKPKIIKKNILSPSFRKEIKRRNLISHKKYS